MFCVYLQPNSPSAAWKCFISKVQCIGDMCFLLPLLQHQSVHAARHTPEIRFFCFPLDAHSKSRWRPCALCFVPLIKVASVTFRFVPRHRDTVQRFTHTHPLYCAAATCGTWGESLFERSQTFSEGSSRTCQRRVLPLVTANHVGGL